jgi:hypothetical protein
LAASLASALAAEMARRRGGAKEGGGEEDEPEWLREAGEQVGIQAGHRGEGSRAGEYATGRGGRGGRGGGGGRGGRGGVVTAASRDAATVVRRLAFERTCTAVGTQMGGHVGVEVGTQVEGAGMTEVGTQAMPRAAVAATQTAGACTAEAGAQATATAADAAVQTATPDPPSPPSLLSRASQTDAGSDDLAFPGGPRRGGGRQRERARTARQRAAGATATALTAGEQARAREDLELCTGVSLEDIERRLEAARARAHVRGWDWADGLDDEALA